MTAATPIGLAALTVLDCPPVAHIGLAERHGFDTVGLRLLPAVPGTTAYPLHEDRAALAEVSSRLNDSPVTVFDVEIVRLAADFDLPALAPVLDCAARLGARAVLVAGDDDEPGRLASSYARLAGACAERGLVASLEPMPWTAVPDVRAARAILEQADGPGRSLLVDLLHAGRSATTAADLSALPAEWIHYVQVCDGSVPAPTTNAELIRQAREERLVPGEGGLDLTGLLAALPPGTPVSVELPNEPLLRSLGTGPWLDRILAATRATLTSAAARRPPARDPKPGC